MSRVSLIERLYAKKKSIFGFDYDALWAPPMLNIVTPTDIGDLHTIATSAKYSGNLNKKYRMIDEIMQRRGFRKAKAGTNRVVYHFLDLPTFLAKVATGKSNLSDSPAEYANQFKIKPWCTKIFEVSPTGVLGFAERVNPISSREEFISVAPDIFNMVYSKILCKGLIPHDMGADAYMNFGIRTMANGYEFGPVVLDFPYLYELDGRKLICVNKIFDHGRMCECHGEIDFDAGLNHLYCTKCGKEYKATDLSKKDVTIKFVLFDEEVENLGRDRIVDPGNGLIIDFGRSTDTYASKEEYDKMYNGQLEPNREYKVTKTIHRRRNRQSDGERISQFVTSLQEAQALQIKQMKQLISRSPEADKITDEIEQQIMPEMSNTKNEPIVVTLDQEEENEILDDFTKELDKNMDDLFKSGDIEVSVEEEEDEESEPEEEEGEPLEDIDLSKLKDSMYSHMDKPSDDTDDSIYDY